MAIVSLCCVYSFLYAMLRSCSGKKGARKHAEEDENNKEEGVAEEAAARTAKRAPKKARARNARAQRGNVLEDEACEELGDADLCPVLGVAVLDRSNGFVAAMARGARGVVRRPAAAQQKPDDAETHQKEKKEKKKPAVQAKKKLARQRKKKALDVSCLLPDDSDCESDGPPGLVDSGPSSDDDIQLDVSTLLPDDEDLESNFGDEDYSSPLIEIINKFVSQIPTNDWVKLVENWKTLECLSSRKERLPCGSGCTGSGMDQHVIIDVTEVHCA